MVARSRADRRAAERAGHRAEWLAGLWLRLKGFRVLARNVRTPHGEIDLIARRGKIVTFVEVKRRDDEDDARRAVTVRQRDRIAHGARYLADSGRFGPGAESFRFDVVIVRRGRLPLHIPDAWRP
ncbi:YraN family protein [Minwuia thermotolerans]|nr:YraN family protein [Minwuia thermotolerans]